MVARAGNHAHLFFAAFSSDGSAKVDRAVIAAGLCDRSILDADAASPCALVCDLDRSCGQFRPQFFILSESRQRSLAD